MKFIRKGLAKMRRLIRAVPEDYFGPIKADTQKFHYVPESELSAVEADLIIAKDLEPWRIDASGEPWYRLENQDNEA